MKLLNVNVTAEHIQGGTRGNTRECPVALAIRQADNDLMHVRVFPNIIFYVRISEGRRYEVEPPESVVQFITEYDDENERMPISFIIDESKAFSRFDRSVSWVLKRLGSLAPNG